MSWENITDRAVHVVVIVVLALVARWLVAIAIKRMVALSTDRARLHLERLGRPGRLITEVATLDTQRQRARAATMGSMLGSAATFVIATIAILTILADLGVNLTPVLASAGVGGVALAFGAQSLVKDVISGIFMVVEDQYGVGDQVKIGEVSGAIEEVGLRVTTVRDASGMLWYLRNGEITTVANISQGWSMATVDVLVHPDEDPSRAIAVLEPVCAEIGTDPEFTEALVEAPTVLGVEKITSYAMTIRLSAKCAANQQWGVQRTLLAHAKRALDESGVRPPAQGWPQG